MSHVVHRQPIGYTNRKLYYGKKIPEFIAISLPDTKGDKLRKKRFNLNYNIQSGKITPKKIGIVSVQRMRLLSFRAKFTSDLSL